MWNKQEKRVLARCGIQMSISADGEKKDDSWAPFDVWSDYSYGNRYMQHPGGLGKHVLVYVDLMAK